MKNYRKLKAPGFPKEMLLPFIILPAFILVLKIVSFSAAYLTLAPFFVIAALVNLLIYRRTRNYGFLVACISMMLATGMSVFVGIHGKGIYNPYLVLIIVLLVMTFPIILYMVLTKRTKWRKREMLELAAMEVEETGGGFTDRPFPAGQLDCSQEELNGFVDFLRTNMIALPVYESYKVNLVINTDYDFTMGLNHSVWNKTWVSVDEEGQVLVHLSKKDYLMYREEYSYDQLCEALGALVIKFFNLYVKEEEQRIIDLLNDLNLNIVTEG
jgi:hypothetical protein